MDRINQKSRLTALLIIALFAATGAAQTSTFTYQGHLSDNGTQPTATYAMEFRLFGSSAGNDQIGVTVTFDGVGTNPAPVPVANGVFNVQLDFGATAFDGNARWLQIAVKKPTDSSFVTLNPRQAISSTPYALRTVVATSSDALSSACTLCVTDAHIQAVNGSKVIGKVANADNASTAENVTGIVQIDNGGTGSSTKSFVDLSHNQIIAGRKTFTDPIFGDGSQLTNVVNLSSNQTIAGSKTFTDPITGDGSFLTNVPGTLTWQLVSGVSQQALSNTGYLANNDAQVTITLPAAPKVGDIVRVSGIGAGGWRLVQNAGQFIVGGANLNSPAADWTAHLPSGPWQSIASSADGMKLVVCGTDSQFLTGKIYTSTDFGVTWTQRDVARQWRAVASSDDGTNLVAVVDHGLIYTSNNSGESWDAHLSTTNWRGVASSSSGNKLAAVSTGAVITSSDGGNTWSAPQGLGLGLRSVASSALGDKLVVVGQQIYTSTDSGANWTPRESSRVWSAVASSADGSKLVAVVDGGLIYTSTDSGVTWAPREASRSWQSVASSADGSRLVATVANGQIYVSTDFGNNWAPRAFTNAWDGVASSADGTRLVATVNVGQIYTSSQNTTLGPEGYLTGGQFASLELQYVGNGKFLPISHEGTILGH